MVEVVATDEFAEWCDGSTSADQDAVDRVVALLTRDGVRLGHPWSSALRGVRFALRELRVQSRGRPLRVIHAFDPRRAAVLLVGGDKTGDDRFYERMVPVAERIWEQYLAEQKAGLHDEEG